MNVSFTDNTSTMWVSVEFKRARGEGRVIPSLILECEARTPIANARVELHHLKAELFQENEYLGEGSVEYKNIHTNGSSLEFRIPLRRSTLAYLVDRLSGPSVSLTMRFHGSLRVRTEDPPRYASSIPAGEWVFVQVGGNRMTELKIQIPRSEWFAHVLEPMGLGNYVFTEIVLPAGVLNPAFSAAVQCLQTAESHYVVGNDPEVFLSAARPSKAWMEHPRTSTTR